MYGFGNFYAGIVRDILTCENDFAKLAVDLPRRADTDAGHIVGVFPDNGHDFVHQVRSAEIGFGRNLKRLLNRKVFADNAVFDGGSADVNRKYFHNFLRLLKNLF